MKTAKQYLDSLSKLDSKIYLLGKKVDDWVNDPIIRPSVNAVAMTYKVANEPENARLGCITSSISSKPINKFNAIFQSTDDLVNKIKFQRLLGQRTACCFQRCVGLDGINAVYSTTYEIDEKYKTDYHKRFKQWLQYVQENDLTVAGCMTDVKGNRGLTPVEQADPDMYVHVVERRKDGVVIKGAKASQTGAANSHEQLIMPTMRMREQDKDYAICCAVPSDAPGVTFIYGRQPCDTRKLETGDIDVGNYMFGGQETLTVFDNVFVPYDRIFMCGEFDFTIMMVERFAGYHRQSYGGCKPGIGDVLVGAAASMADYNGTRKAAHIKDKLAEMVHLVETIYSCGLACSYEGWKTKAGNYQVNILLANICKLNVTRIPYELLRLAEDITGGLLVTIPSEADLRNPEIGPFIEKYFKGVDNVPAEERLRMVTLIHAMSYGLTAPSYRTESLHGAGSPQAQKIMIERESGIECKQELARRLAGIDKREII
jgi:4-hydroxybutyryl-CoA dehydratase / vinylacetyl-CoA-Delta-isomerase